MIPRFKPIIAAWVRSLAPSLERMLRTCTFTVASLMERRLAISLLPAFGDEGQDPGFTCGQRIIRGMLSKLE